MQLCGCLAKIFGLCGAEVPKLTVDWGNGILYDEDKLWQSYLQMVDKGLLKPEIALGWRFGMKTDTQEELQAVRERYMP